MQPGINTDTFGSESNESQNDNNRDTKHTSDNINERDTTSRKQDNDHENKVNDVSDNKKVDSSWEAESKTDNEDEDDWEDKQGLGPTSSNRGTEYNDWNENDQVQRTSGPDREDPYEIYAKDDYIDGDHSDYNRNNSRFRWEEPEE
jgi:hypothetical protein